MENQNQSSQTGTVVGIVVILAILVVGAFYFWGMQDANNTLIPSQSNMTEDSIENLELELENFEEVTL